MNIVTWHVSISCSHRSFISAAQLPTDSELPAPSSLRPANYTSAHPRAPISHTSPKELAVFNLEDARRRIDEVAEVI